MGKELRGALILGDNSKPDFSDQDAVWMYHDKRNRTEHLSLIGKGRESAACLMLASRFMPDQIHIFPLLGSGIDAFLKDVSKRVSFLYFVCAPIRIYVSKTVTDYEKTRLKRLLRSISSFQKEIVYVENESCAYRNLTNLYKTTKTLA